jgi:hypothetical protein
VVLTDTPLQLSDARRDPLVSCNLAREELGVVAYFGRPARTALEEMAGALGEVLARGERWRRCERWTQRSRVRCTRIARGCVR